MDDDYIHSIPEERSGHVAAHYRGILYVLGGYGEDILSWWSYDSGRRIPVFVRSPWHKYIELSGNMFVRSIYHPLSDIWLYVQDLEKWAVRKAGGRIPQKRSGATACVRGHNLYMYGGHTVSDKTSELCWLDLERLCWREIPDAPTRPIDMPSPRDKTASWTYAQSLYIFGGYGSCPIEYMNDHGEYILDEVEGSKNGWNNHLFIYNLRENRWSNPACEGDIPSPRAAHAVDVIGSTAYLFGGRHKGHRLNDLYSLDLTFLQWTRIVHTGRTPLERSWHSFTAVSPTHLCLFGGFSQDMKPLGDMWVFDVESQVWQSLRSSTETADARLWHTACLMRNNRVFVFGGCLTNIHDTTRRAVHANNFIELQTTPQSLKGIAMDAVFHKRAILRPLWEDLPTVLANVLNYRVQVYRLAQFNWHQVVDDM